MTDEPQGLMELSQVNFGLVLDGRRSPFEYKPEWFHPPYDLGIKVLQEPGASKEDVAQVIKNTSYINDAHESVIRWNGIGESLDWPKALRKCHESFVIGDKLLKLGKKFKNNEPVDVLSFYGEMTSMIANDSNGLTVAKDIDYTHYKPFKKCGYAPIDLTLGGIPSDGPIIIVATTGTGKSKFATILISSLLSLYPKERAAVYTLEMSKEHWLNRSLALVPSLKKVLDRLYVSGSVRDIDELVAEVTAKKVDYVVLDDIDNIVRSYDASEYERVYKRVKEICRFMNIPVFTLCQPNREVKKKIKDGEKFIDLYDASWSGASENSAALFIGLQTTNGLDMKSGEFPTTDDDLDYLIMRKSRDGWPADRDPKAQRGPGAIVLEHTSNWSGKFYGGTPKIWTPQSEGKNKIGKKER